MLDRKVHNINLGKAPEKLKKDIEDGIASGEGTSMTVSEFSASFEDYLANRPWYRKIFDSVARIGYRAQNLVNDTKHLYQRNTRGYSDIDIWGPGIAIIEFSYPVVNAFYQRMKEGHTYGVPVDFISKDGTPDAKAWEEVVGKITRALELQYNYEINFGDDIDELHQALIDEDPKKKKYKALRKEIDEGMELFGKYLLALWD